MKKRIIALLMFMGLLLSCPISSLASEYELGPRPLKGENGVDVVKPFDIED